MSLWEHPNRHPYTVEAQSLGEVWLNLIKSINLLGEVSDDEGRERRALANIRLLSLSQSLPDPIIEKLGHRANLEAMVRYTFSDPVIEDCDVNPSFQSGAPSYHQRLLEGQQVEFVVERLSLIPESKKAILIFPTYQDFVSIRMDHRRNDYLPCLVCLQFRLLPRGTKEWELRTSFFARSMDVVQKGHANLVIIAKLGEIVAKQVSLSRNEKVTPTLVDGLVTDAHIYHESYAAAQEIINRSHHD